MAIQLTQRSKELILRNALAVLAKQNNGKGAPVETYNGDDHAYAIARSLKECGAFLPDENLPEILEVLQRGGNRDVIKKTLLSPAVIKETVPTVVDSKLLN